MSEGSPDFRRSLRRVLQTADGKDHPALDTLEAFHWGDLPADKADQVRGHISGCPHCLDLLAKLDEFNDAMPAAEVEVPTGELERSLGRVQERLRAEAAPIAEIPGAVSSAPPASRPRFFPRWSTAPGPYALVAASLAIGIGLSSWLASRLEIERQRVPELESSLAAASARTAAAEEKLEGARQQALSLEQQAIALRRERDQLLAPQPNTPIVDLRASGERSGGAGQVTEIHLPPDVKFISLVLEDPGEAVYSEYWAVLRSKEGIEIGPVGPLERTPFRNFVLSLGVDQLGPYEQRVTLLGRSSGKLLPVAQYRFRIDQR
jgi:anti-sigma factor RsiW